MNNFVKEESTTDTSTSVVYPKQASASDLPTVGGSSSTQMVNGDVVEDQVTPIRSSDAFVGKRRKRRNVGTDAIIVESPDWLPKGWITELKSRKSGSTAGRKDKYYCDPVSGHRFRSKPDVLWFLHTGEMTKKRKSKLLGSGYSESQPFPLQSADILNLKKPDINSSSGVSSNLNFEVSLISVPTDAQKDEDESTCRQNRKAYIPMSSGFRGEARQFLEVTRTAVQDLLPEENNKRKNLNTECMMDMKQIYHPVFEREMCKEEKECENHGLQDISMSKNFKPNDMGSKEERSSRKLKEMKRCLIALGRKLCGCSTSC